MSSKEKSTRRTGWRSPVLILGFAVLPIWFCGWWVAANRPLSFGWPGNPRGDGYLALHSLILDLTFDPDTGWSVEKGDVVPLTDLTELDYSGYREEAGLFKIHLARVPDLPKAYHFSAGFPALIGLHLLLLAIVETLWRYARHRVLAKQDRSS